MKRRDFLTKAALATGGTVAVLGKPTFAQSNPTVKWRLASSFPKALDTIFGAAEVFAQKVTEMSGGKFQITVHSAGEIMPAFEVLDGVQQGSIELAHTAPYYFFGKDETFAIDCAIPFGMNSRQMTAWMYQGNGMKLMREFYSNYNIVNFPMGNTGSQMGGWYRKQIKSTIDIKGLKMRLGGFAGRVLGELGAVPQNIPGGEVYQALEKGTIDAAEWVGPYDDAKLGFNRVAKYYYYPGWWEGGAQLTLMVNNKAYNSLSQENKTILEAAASFAHVNMQAMYDARNPVALKKLASEGTVIKAFPKSVLNAAFKARQDVFASLNKSNPNWKKIYADYASFQKDSVIWERFAEGTFSSFMGSQKL